MDAALPAQRPKEQVQGSTQGKTVIMNQTCDDIPRTRNSLYGSKIAILRVISTYSAPGLGYIVSSHSTSSVRSQSCTKTMYNDTNFPTGQLTRTRGKVPQHHINVVTKQGYSRICYSRVGPGPQQHGNCCLTCAAPPAQLSIPGAPSHHGIKLSLSMYSQCNHVLVLG